MIDKHFLKEENHHSFKIGLILKLLLLYQFVICLFTPMEVYLDVLIPELMILLFVSLAFWFQIEPSIKYRELMEQVSEANYEFTMRVLRMKIDNSEIEGKQRLKVANGALGIFSGIALLAFLIIFFVYVSTYFLWIAFHFVKLTRISALVVFIAGIVYLVRILNLSKKNKEKYKNSVTIIGLLVENILISMVVFIF